jgi:hypothetical protein
MAKTIEQIQAMITGKADQREVINELTDYIQANPSSQSTSSYLKYVPLLNQSGSNAPVVTPLENTIGNIVWTRLEAGSYKGTLVGAFPLDKTWIPGFTPDGSVMLRIPFNGSGYWIMIGWDVNAIYIQTFNNTGSFVDYSNIVSGVDVPLALPEIRVYQ